MTKQDIIEYVMDTPYNTNRAVLSSMLNQLAEGGGGGGDSSDFFRIKFSTSDMINFTCDKTFAEMKAARDAGKYFIATNEASLTVGGTTIVGTVSLDTWGYSSQTNEFTFIQANFSEDVDQNVVASISKITVSSTDVIVGELLSGTIPS